MPKATSKPKPKPRRSKKKPDSPLAAIRWDMVARSARPAGVGLSVLALGLGLTFGLSALNARAADQLGTRLAADELPVAIQWPRVPGGTPEETWLPETDRALLLRKARAAIREPEPLSVHPLAAIADAFGESGWFDGEPSVHRDGRGRIVIAGDWRVPAAVVRHGGWDHLISWSGMPMPRRYGPGTSNQRIILGAALGPGPASNPALRYKAPWPGEDVAAGISLLRLLAERALVDEVEAIDVSAYAQGRLEIVTIHATRVEWGAAPGQWRPGQATDEERLSRLERLRSEYGRLDGGAQRVRIAGAHVERIN